MVTTKNHLGVMGEYSFQQTVDITLARSAEKGLEDK